MSRSETAPPGLVQLGTTPSLVDYVRSLWRRRAFALATARGEMHAQHMDTALDSVWHLLNPILLILVYYVVFGVLLGISRGVDNFIGYLSIGVFTYHWSQKSTMSAARTIISNEGLIRSLQFPRALLPIASVFRETLAFLPAVAVMMVTVLVSEHYQDAGINPLGLQVTWAWLLVVPSLLVQLVFNLGAAFIVARVSDKFRDTVNILPFLFRLAFYASGVIYSVEVRLAAVDRPDLIKWFLLDPFYVFISLPREYLLSGVDQAYVGWMWVSALAWATAALLAGLVAFRNGEREFGRG